MWAILALHCPYIPSNDEHLPAVVEGHPHRDGFHVAGDSI